jgi:hypothetical protein
MSIVRAARDHRSLALLRRSAIVETLYQLHYRHSGDRGATFDPVGSNKMRRALVATITETISQERERIAARLAKVDSERTKLTDQLTELEATERVLSRIGKPTRTRGRPKAATPATNAAAKAKTPSTAPKRGRLATKANMTSSTPSLGECVVATVIERPGLTPAEILAIVSKQLSATVRPNHLGIALQRHRRGGRLETRDSRWYPSQTTQQSAGA